jgi:hypothetical protein
MARFPRSPYEEAHARKHDLFGSGALEAELEHRGIRAFLVDPGFTATERIQADMKGFVFEGGSPVEGTAKVVARLATSRDADAFTGANIEAQSLCHELRPLPGWPGPTPHPYPPRTDRSGAQLEDVETALRRGRRSRPADRSDAGPGSGVPSPGT